MKINKKFLLLFISVLTVFSSCLFAKDNMLISIKDDGEVITGFKTPAFLQELKITVAYPDNYMQEDFSRAPLVLLFDTAEYSIADLKQMFRQGKNKNDFSDFLIASVRFKNDKISAEEFNAFIAEIFSFFQLNYSTETEPSKRLLIAKNNLALFALVSLNQGGNYFSNLGMLLDMTTSLPSFDIPFEKQNRVMALSGKTNILNLQNLFIKSSLEPMQNFFLKIQEESSVKDFDLRYFFRETPKLQKIQPVLDKEISQETPFYLQVKTSYGSLDFFPTQIRFTPPVLGYDESLGVLQVLLPEPVKVKISGVFAGKKWKATSKIAK